MACSATSRSRSRSPVRRAPLSDELSGIEAVVVNLDRRADRWERFQAMVRTETPWLKCTRMSASNGAVMDIPESEVATVWNTNRNALFADYEEWIFVAPGTDLNGKQWKWCDDVKEDDKEWRFIPNEDDDDHATIEKIASGEQWSVRREIAERFRNPGMIQRLSGGERGCAHSHRRIWEMAAERQFPTLVFEDDATIAFQREKNLGLSNGTIFTGRLRQAMKELPSDFDVLYLGWSGHRGGNFKYFDETECNGSVIKKVEYVWTTHAYVITPAGARKLLTAAQPINQPVDNFMGWEASQRRLKSFVCLDAADDDASWAGGIVDQLNFAEDSDIPKSDGGHQGDDCDLFTVGLAAA